jgi:hypothetical protein
MNRIALSLRRLCGVNRDVALEDVGRRLRRAVATERVGDERARERRGNGDDGEERRDRNPTGELLERVLHAEHGVLLLWRSRCAIPSPARPGSG